MKRRTIVKIGIGISAGCAALLTADSVRSSKRAEKAEAEAEAAKAEAEAAKAEAEAAKAEAAKAEAAKAEAAKAEAVKVNAYDLDDVFDFDFEDRLESKFDKLDTLMEKGVEFIDNALVRAEAKAARKAAKAEAKAAKKAAKAEA